MFNCLAIANATLLLLASTSFFTNTLGLKRTILLNLSSLGIVQYELHPERARKGLVSGPEDGMVSCDFYRTYSKLATYVVQVSSLYCYVSLTSLPSYL